MQVELHANGALIAKGETDNPYQIRNFIVQRIRPPLTFLDNFTAFTADGYMIKANADLQAILAPTSQIINEQPPLHPIPIIVRPIPVGPQFTLKELCAQLRVPGIVARRRLR